jgi:hypothetical protein
MAAAAIALWTQRQLSAPAELKQLWAGFLDTPDPPLVVYSNAEFVGRPETGMRYFDPQRDEKQTLLDHYTGVGEVQAVYELGHMFHRFNRALRVKRGRLLSWDDAKANDVVFIGSPSENLSLRDLPTTRRFSFERESDGDRKGDLVLVDRTPEPGSAARYHASAGLPISEDYAFVGLTPGLNAGHWVMVLAGITTMGTQAAVEFVCRPTPVRQLLERLQVGPGADVPPFEAILRVKVSGGVPVQTEVVKVKRGR